MSVSVLKVIDLQPTYDSARPAPSIRQDAPWHGFRLAADNEAPLAYISAMPSSSEDERSRASTDGLDGSLAWVGRLACWASALFTATLIVLAVS